MTGQAEFLNAEEQLQPTFFLRETTRVSQVKAMDLGLMPPFILVFDLPRQQMSGTRLRTSEAHRDST